MITKQAFDAFIASFNKEPGEYTLEELFEIGAMHKELPLQDKSWKWLTKKVGYPGQASSYRNFIFRRQQALEMLLPKKQETQETAASQQTAEETSPQWESTEFEELFRKRVEIGDLYNAYKRSLRNESRLNTFKELLFKNIQELKTLPEIKYLGKPGSDNAEAILLVSDLHLGIDCNNFYNVYNKDVAKQRLNKLSAEAIRYCEKFNIKQLNILGLGDFIQGIIHVNGRIQAQMNVVEQVILASEYLADFLNSLAAAAPIVTYRSCTDNHSRVIANKEEAIEGENLNKLIDFYLETRLAKTPIRFVKDNLDESLGSFHLMSGKHIVYAHGHLDSINKSFENFVGATKKFVDYMILGHYHCEKAKSFQGARVFVNGSICGTEDYALSKRLFSEPSQTLLIFNDDNILNISINLKNA